MAASITLRDLDELDIPVLRDLVAFGALTNDQIERRYGDPHLAAGRLELLFQGGFVRRDKFVQDTTVFYPSRLGNRVSKLGLRYI
jgi:hypothetical protein